MEQLSNASLENKEDIIQLNLNYSNSHVTLQNVQPINSSSFRVFELSRVRDLTKCSTHQQLELPSIRAIKSTGSYKMFNPSTVRASEYSSYQEYGILQNVQPINSSSFGVFKLSRIDCVLPIVHRLPVILAQVAG